MIRKARTPAATTSRGTFRSMRVTDGFHTFVLEQLEGVESVLARTMFGGVGLYTGGVFFGILAADTLYLKVDDSNRGQYEAERMTAWVRASVRVAARAALRKARR